MSSIEAYRKSTNNIKDMNKDKKDKGAKDNNKNKSNIKNKDNKNINKSNIKVYSDDLIVGHHLDKTVRLYSESEGWFYAYDFYYENNQNILENNVIIGYYDKSDTGTELKFKLRPPVQKIKNKEEIRHEERGRVCLFYEKDELAIIAKQLGLDTDDRNVKRNICNAIKNKLIDNENKERCKCLNKRVRWFYRHFEDQPTKSK